MLWVRWSKCWSERKNCRVMWSNIWTRWKSRSWNRWRGATTVRCGIIWSNMSCQFRPVRKCLYPASSTHPHPLRHLLQQIPLPNQIRNRFKSPTLHRHTCPTGVQNRVSQHVTYPFCRYSSISIVIYKFCAQFVLEIIEYHSLLIVILLTLTLLNWFQDYFIWELLMN